MLKYFKYKLSPTESQSILLNKHIGANRFVYNLALECKKMAWDGNKVNLSRFDLHSQLKDLKTECEWLKEVGAQSLQQTINNLDKAYAAFFRGQRNFPKYKKKSEAGSFSVPQGVALKNGKLVIRKFKEGIDIVLHRPIKGEIRRAAISRSATGKYFVSILCETGETKPTKPLIAENTTVGIDLGIKTFIVTSDGKEYDNPKFLRKAQSKLKYVQRKFSKHKGKRTKHRLAILHEKVTNQRKDFLNKVSTELIRDNQSIAIETLQVSNMLKNHKLAQSISDAGWGMFVLMLKNKAEWYGKNILKIGTFEPSSKTCSCCGRINKELALKDREWTCGGCGALLNRDANAAINIKNFALRNYLSVERRLENRNELPTLVGVLTSEAPSLFSEV